MSTDGAKAYLYQDGELIHSDDTTVASTTEPLLIGHTLGVFFSGMIDEVRFYNRNLSEDEINQNMNAEGLAVEYPAQKLSLTWGKIKAQD